MVSIYKWATTFFFSTVIFTCPVKAIASKIDLEAGVYSELIWTDNADIASVKRDSDIYTSINPYVRAKRDGKRIKANIDYQAKVIAYNKHTGRNDLNHLLRGNLDAELLKERLFTNIYVAVDREVVDPDSAISFDDLLYGDNTTDKYTARVSPGGVIPILKDIGLDFSSSHGKILYDYGLADVDEHKANASLGTASRSSGVNWGVNAGKQYVQTENNNPSEYEQIDFSASVPVFNRTLLSVKYGEKREVLSSTADRSWQKGKVWSCNLGYALSSKTKLEFGGGEDLYNDQLLFSLTHAAVRSHVKVNYIQSEITLITQEINEDMDRVRAQKFGRAIDAVYVQKKGDISWRLIGSKNIIDLYLAHEERYYRNIDENENMIRARLMWEHKVSGRSNLRAAVNWWRLGDDQQDRLDDMAFYSLRYNINFDSKSNWYAGVDAGIRDGVQSALEYKEFKFRIGAELRY